MKTETVSRDDGSRSRSAKQRTLTGQAIGLGRPAELAQDRRGVEDVAARRLGPLAVHETGEMRLVEVAESRAPRIHQMNAGVAGARRERLHFDPPADQRGHDIAVHGRVVETRPAVAQRDERPEDRAARAARATVDSPGRVLLFGLVVRRQESQKTREMLGAGAGDRSGISSRTRSRRTSPARSAAPRPAYRPRLPRRAWRSGAPRLEQPIERLGVAEISGLGERAIERRNVIDVRRVRLQAGPLPKSKCGDRSSAIAGPRAKFALTHDSTRSSAAAYGSAASGSASNIWQAIPADRITSRAT